MKPTIPNEVADVIEYLRSDKKWSNQQIIECRNIAREEIEAVRILRKVPFDTLMAALVNGYERELTEEQRHQKIREMYREYGEYLEIRDFGAREGMRRVLSVLGIQIEGVNA
ncbi:hypothetical protein M5X04_26765 [Paenibacillus alvei]|uniref:Phage protein n=1 Tax=Paenibacillus alvei TaxID=44250 RepID=A0ABT4EH24_PAEAL|nr:hypothetical protein [Paenibacillus alvei]MCY9532915.1 hypothetical protein [Paenibacillus alvei]